MPEKPPQEHGGLAYVMQALIPCGCNVPPRLLFGVDLALREMPLATVPVCETTRRPVYMPMVLFTAFTKDASGTLVPMRHRPRVLDQSLLAASLPCSV